MALPTAPPFLKGGQGGIKLWQLLKNAFQYPRGILKDFPGRNSNDRKAQICQVPVPPGVLGLPFFRIMLASINFDHQLGCRTIKVHDLVTNNPLAVKPAIL
jgi:hypothetical protein